ncbi:putative ribosomal protein S18 [Rosellinia necatrix]|uniref:Small ribosomal subunit protein bS18m n=1 Tax=Rosellinia necatrix TaxID=77044 RepID=A0A1S7UJ07_ROSNE|nr:putative ribosomal protein S18 [Rosellinia necatrix]
MPPRLPIPSALRRGLSFLQPRTKAPLSTTAAPQAGRGDPRTAPPPPPPPSPPTTTTSSILSLGGDGGRGAPSSRPSTSTQALSNIYKDFSGPRPNRGSGGSGGGGGGGMGGSGGGGSGGSQYVEDMLRGNSRHNAYMRQLTRRWRPGDVYAPHDMSPSEMTKWRRTTARQKDLVDLLGIRPLDMYRNFSVISEFMTPHGRIMRGVETGLNPVNQRKMAKAIRRAIGLGLHPSVHRHPEILVRGPHRVLAQKMAKDISNTMNHF